MADLTFPQGSDPVSIYNETSGNQMAVNADGSISADIKKINGVTISLGQATKSASLPVVIASDQVPIPVTTEGAKNTYSAAFIGLVPAAATTDLFTIQGSSTKTIRITSLRFTVSTTAGSGILSNISLVKRSTVDSGGTSTIATNVPHDSTNLAGTAVVRGYTANPTLGTSVGAVRSVRYAATPASVPNQEMYVEFGTRPSQTMILRGTSEQLCLNLGGSTITGPIADFSIEWTEE
jgi:hypothetical protein